MIHLHEARRICGLVFDLDGVLADSEQLHVEAWALVLQNLHLPFDINWRRDWVAVPDDQICRLIESRFPPPLSADGLLESKRRAFLDLVPVHLKAFPGVVDGLATLSRIPMGIGTSSSRREAELMLDTIGIRHAFSAIVTGDDVSRIKPAPDIYLLAANHLNLPPRVCLAVEDSLAGVEAAWTAGMAVIAVATSFAPERLSHADRVFASPGEAIRWIKHSISNRSE